jgi:hypothetical protein
MCVDEIVPASNHIQPKLHPYFKEGRGQTHEKIIVNNNHRITVYVPESFIEKIVI